MAKAFAIIHPYTDRPDRLQTGTIYDVYATGAEAFAVLGGIRERLHRFNIPRDAIEMLVVDAERRRCCGATELRRRSRQS
jgi:hypothetical protein